MVKAKISENKVEAYKVRGKGRGESAEGEGGDEGKAEAAPGQAGAGLSVAVIEVDKARQAFEELRAELVIVREVEIVQRKIDMQRAAAVAHSVATRDTEPGRLAEFERLASTGLYSVSQIFRLGQLALAAWFVRYMLELGQFRASNALVPEAVLRRAQLVRARMMQVVDYWLGSVSEVALRLEFLRTGSGYQDLANDLQELARLYERDDFRAVLRPGVPHYHETDRNDARVLATTIFAGLGLSGESETERWSGLADRVWTLLRGTYDDHRAKGVFLFSSQEDVSVTYPSLTSAVRSAPARRRSPEAPEPEEGEEPTGSPAGEPAEEGQDPGV